MKPSDFFVGVVDFFSILLPGAAVTFVFERSGEATTLGLPTTGTAGWIAFLFGAYLAGHLIFLLGSSLDSLYDMRRHRLRTEYGDGAFQAATRLRERITPELAGSSVTTLKWAKSVVGLRSKEARAEIDALEATSKFFRSLVVLFVLASPLLLARQDLTAGSRVAGMFVVLVLARLSFLRFCDQRWKLTELAYTYVLLVQDGQMTTVRS